MSDRSESVGNAAVDGAVVPRPKPRVLYSEEADRQNGARRDGEGHGDGRAHEGGKPARITLLNNPPPAIGKTVFWCSV